MKIVIIEDEKLTAKDLAATIRGVEPDAEILPFLYSVEEAVRFFEQQPEVDLIFSDIELGDGLSFDIFEQVNTQTPIIFCTAYQQYALEAFQTLGIDYVLKPFNKQAIEKTLQKFKQLKDKLAKKNDNLDSLIGSLKNSLLHNIPSVIVYQGEKIIPISGSDIAFFFIENEGTFAYTFAQKKYPVSQKLDKLEQTFPSFFRANRQFLINRKAVKDASQYFNRKMLINLLFPYKEPIVVGKLKTTEFIHWLSQQ
ncbi:LytTR family DNA-binding domain-containing protein [Rhodocytophaga aerolata]|uniref:LytTR family DNA-binding domain-containing protein n=1 Tax=Rhodocytophaga aerolata TaxID=455078 RepID=A0ABT8RBC2_9BACT|nr:LytTR family DNA-binding domain-containing protein [Rhodocytophaga aerolata]MDO1449370.1 LytTR family DNA-binding domain-containing protein [Rhodocytophaga aerolata]